MESLAIVRDAALDRCWCGDAVSWLRWSGTVADNGDAGVLLHIMSVPCSKPRLSAREAYRIEPETIARTTNAGIPLCELLHGYSRAGGNRGAGIARFDHVEFVAVIHHIWLRRRGRGDTVSRFGSCRRRWRASNYANTGILV